MCGGTLRSLPEDAVLEAHSRGVGCSLLSENPPHLVPVPAQPKVYLHLLVHILPAPPCGPFRILAALRSLQNLIAARCSLLSENKNKLYQFCHRHCHRQPPNSLRRSCLPARDPVCVCVCGPFVRTDRRLSTYTTLRNFVAGVLVEDFKFSYFIALI